MRWWWHILVYKVMQDFYHSPSSMYGLGKPKAVSSVSSHDKALHRAEALLGLLGCVYNVNTNIATSLNVNVNNNLGIGIDI